MKKLTFLLLLMIVMISCEKQEISPLDNLIGLYAETYSYEDSITGEIITYEFRMDGMCEQDNNGYYRLPLIGENQTQHRFGGYITNVDFWGLPAQVIWSSGTVWSYYDEMGYEHVIPLLNGTSFADPNIDSVYCIMSPIADMQGDTATIYGQAWFEEGDIILKDSINFIFE